MDAYILTAYGPHALTRGETPAPVPGPGEVAIRVEAIGINPLDWKIRNGYLAEMIPLPLPAVLGSDIAGTVVTVGPGVDGFAAGDRVTGFADSGAYAELATTRTDRVAHVPAGLTPEQAVTLLTAAETAQRGLALLAPSPGATIVVNGAAGSVGSAVVQLLVADGHTVLGTASSVNHEYVRSLGAVPVTYAETMLDEIRTAAPEGVDAAFDTAGRGFVSRMTEIVPASRVVTIVDFAAGALGAIVAGGDPTALTAETVPPVLDLAAQGRFRTEVTRRFTFDELPAALALSEAGHLRGKIVVLGKEG